MIEKKNGHDRWSSPEMVARLRKRQRAERTFRWLGALAILFALGSLAILIGTTAISGVGAFVATEIRLDVDLAASAFDSLEDLESVEAQKLIAKADYRGIVRDALRNLFPDVANRKDKRDLGSLVSRGAGGVLRDAVLDDRSQIG